MNDKKPTIQGSSYDNGVMKRICPNCHKEKPLSDFGLRDMGNGNIRNQSWCKDCRSKTINR